MIKYKLVIKRSLSLTFISGLICGLLHTLLGCSGSGMPANSPNPTMVEGLYVHTFGDPKSTAVILIHDGFGDPSVPAANRPLGGPTVNSMSLEHGLAKKLADKNFYVIAYDQRGQGRSADARTSTDYSYKQYSDDIKTLIATYQLSHPILIGHSHGGIIALKFDEMNPGASRKIVLVDTPLDVFQVLNTISTNCQARYDKVGETSKVTEIKDSLDTLANTNTPRIERSVSVAKIFEQAGTCGGSAGLYSTKAPTVEATKFYKMLSSLVIPISKSNQASPISAFLANEDHIHINAHAYVAAHSDHIVGIYGSEDSFFDSNSLAQLKTSLGAGAHPERFAMVEAASHNSFIDQSVTFLAALNAMLVPK